MDNKNENLQKYKYVPPDGGWGWLVLFGCTLINLLVPGTIKSFGVIFVEFLEIFEFSEIAASWIPALCYFLYCSLGPLASYLSNKFSYRTVTLIGGCFASVGMILSYFATSVVCLCITYGILFGTGAGLSFPPGIFIVTSYFQKYRGIANGIAISGSAFGSMILPPLLQYLLENYGVNGTVLIMGAITMNVWVGALFYHPVKWHMQRIPVITESPNEIITDSKLTKHENASETLPENCKPGKLIKNKIITSVHYNSHSKKFDVKRPSLKATDDKLRRNSSYVSVSSTKFTASCESTLGRTYPEYASQITLKSLSESLNRFSCWKTNQVEKPENNNKELSQLVELFSNPAFIIILISNASTAIGYTNFTIYLPAYAISLNYDKTLSSCLLSVVAMFDLIGRIGGSTISDILPLHKKFYFIFGLTTSGIALMVLPLARTYTTLCIACAMFGLTSGTYTGITVVTMVEMLGEEKLATSYTISLFVNGVLQLIGPPTCGLIYKNFDSYNAIISGLGLIIIMGAGVWLFLLSDSLKKYRSFRA